MTGGDAFRRLVDRVDALESRLAQLESEVKPTDADRAALARLDARLAKSETVR